MTSDSCYHCGESIPTGTMIFAHLEGQDRPMCCVGCKAVAEFIQSAGFDAFYKFREAPSAELGLRVQDKTWERYDAPDLLNRYVALEHDAAQATIDIGGLYCSACVWLFDTVMEQTSGVESATINPATRRAVIRWDHSQLSFRALLESLARVGFSPVPIVAGECRDEKDGDYRIALKRLIVAAAAGMQVMMFAVALYAGDFFGIDDDIARFLRIISLLVTLPIVFYSAQPFFRSAWRGLRARRLGMDFPVSIAIAAAFSASTVATWLDRGAVFFDSVAMFVFFLNATRFLEMRARHRCEDYGLALAGLLPDTATRIVAGRPETVMVDRLRVGDTVDLKTGDVIPADGIIKSGELFLDESMLTGESMPVRHLLGEEVFAGAIVGQGNATISLTRTGASTNLAEIGRMLDRAKADRPPIWQLADRIASHFVLGVVFVAGLATAIWTLLDPSRAFEIGLATLVVTCPCALALATPAALASATSALARNGILLVRARILQVLADTTIVVFDKTGTLTEGKPSVVNTTLSSQTSLSESECLALAAALEVKSEHVLARAFSPFLLPGKFSLDECSIHPGQGVEAWIDGIRYRLGSQDFVDTEVGEWPVPEVSGSVVYLATPDRVLARFEVNDEPRIDAKVAVDGLRDRGLETVIASGDRREAVETIGDRLGISQRFSGLKPDEKVALVDRLRRQDEVVVMVGDGINDAPVLASADASIALDAGTALARASADAVSLGRRLGTVITAVDVARRTRTVIRQNISWAIGYNLLAIPLAVSGFLQPWMAAIGMSASSLVVVMNALRLRKPAKAPKPEPNAGWVQPEGEEVTA